MMGDFDNPLPAVKTRVSNISTAQEVDPKLKLVRDWVRKGKKPPKNDLVPIDKDILVYWQQFSMLLINKADELCYRFHSN